MDFSTLFNDALLPLVITILTALLSYLTARFVSFINVKTAAIKENVKNEKAKSYIDIAANTANEVVLSLNQQIVEGMKEASKDGKLTKEEAEEIKNKAIANTLIILSDEAKESLNTAFGDIETYLSTVIEAAVCKAKK